MSTRTDKQIAAAQVRSLRTMRERLLVMADPWEDVDEYKRTRLTEASDFLEDVMVELLDGDSCAPKELL